MGVLPPKPSDPDAAATPTTHLSYTQMSSSVALNGNDYNEPSGGGAAKTSHIGYSHRRKVYEVNPDAAVLSGVIGRLPLDIQVAFRRKVLAIFALQLLFVTVVVAAFEWITSLHDAWESVLDGHNAIVAIPSVAMLLFLLALYFVRNKFPWNWVCLFFFSVALCFLYASLGVIFETSVGVINCGAIFVWTLVMIVLSGVRLTKKGSEDAKLLPTLAMGFMGYVVVAALVSVLYAIFKDDFVTRDGLIGTLVFQLMMALWFANDAKAMFRVMTPDEYMHGVIYFYTDIVLLLGIMGIGFLLAEGGGSGPIEPLYFGSTIDGGQIRAADEEA